MLPLKTGPLRRRRLAYVFSYLLLWFLLWLPEGCRAVSFLVVVLFRTNCIAVVFLLLCACVCMCVCVQPSDADIDADLMRKAAELERIKRDRALVLLHFINN